jgi:hypothetical protein
MNGNGYDGWFKLYRSPESPDAASNGSAAEETGSGSKDLNGDNEANSQEGSASISQKDTEAELENKEITDAQKEEVLAGYVEIALGDNLLAFNGMEIKRKFPKAYKAVGAYMDNKSRLPSDDETIIGVVLYTPRNLFYDLFDSNNLFINIHGSDQRWKYSWEANEASDPFTSRVLAEYHGFMEGFQRLEQQLP